MSQMAAHHSASIDSASIDLSVCRDLYEISKFSQVNAHYVDSLPSLADTEVVRLATEESRYWLDWSDSLGAWIELEGTLVTILVHEGARSVDLNHLSLGFASALAGTCLNLQGKVAIHANAVCLGGKAVAFVGPSGAGKSTLSAFCVQQGMGLLTDDVLIVDEGDHVLPGNPRIKLFPHTGEALQLEVPPSSGYKVFYDTETLGIRSAVQHPVSLKAIYLLDSRAADEDAASNVEVSPIQSAQAIFDLLQNSYAVREFANVLPRLFDRYQTLVQKVPILKLSYTHDFSQLSQVYDVLIDRL